MTKKKSIIFAKMGLFLVLGLSSFADETTQITLILYLAKNTSSISMFLLAGFIGAICAGPIAPRLLHHLKPARTIFIVLLCEALFIAAAAIANQFWVYITLSFALGLAGSIFWSAILVSIPEFAKIVLEKLDYDTLTVVGGVGSGCSTGALATFLRKRGIEVNLCGIQPFGSITFGAEAIDDPEIIIAGIGSGIDFLNVKYECYNSINWLSFSACLSGTIELMKAHAIFAGLSSGGSYCVGKREAKLKPKIPCLVILPDTGHRYIEHVFSRHEESQPVDNFEPKIIHKATQLALLWSRFEWNKKINSI